MAAWGYEFYLLVLKVSLKSELILSAREDKIRIPKRHLTSSIYGILGSECVIACSTLTPVSDSILNFETHTW